MYTFGIGDGKTQCVLVTATRAGRSTVMFQEGARDFFSSTKQPDHFWDPPSYYSLGTGHEIHYVPPYIPEVKNGWSFTSSPPILLHGVYGENFTVAGLGYLCPWGVGSGGIALYRLFTEDRHCCHLY